MHSCAAILKDHGVKERLRQLALARRVVQRAVGPGRVDGRAKNASTRPLFVVDAFGDGQKGGDDFRRAAASPLFNNTLSSWPHRTLRTNSFCIAEGHEERIALRQVLYQRDEEHGPATPA